MLNNLFDVTPRITLKCLVFHIYIFLTYKSLSNVITNNQRLHA